MSAFHQELLARVAAVPGVTVAGAVRTAPLAGSLRPNGVEVKGLVPDEDGPPMNADVQVVTAGYFETMAIPLIEGRDFDTRDGTDAPLVAVVSEELAKRYWPDRSALGGRIRPAGFDPALDFTEVVGVVKDIRHESLARPARGTLYFVHAQSPRTWYLDRRTAGQPLQQLGWGHNANDLYRPDAFYNRYVGKIYHKGYGSPQESKYAATEIFSMGLE